MIVAFWAIQLANLHRIRGQQLPMSSYDLFEGPYVGHSVQAVEFRGVNTRQYHVKISFRHPILRLYQAYGTIIGVECLSRLLH